jgi:hypothetical protein
VKGAQDLYFYRADFLEIDRLALVELIRSYNLYLEAILQFPSPEREDKLEKEQEHLSRERALIQGRTLLLIKNLALLNDFATEFDLDRENLDVSLPELASSSFGT